MSFNTKSGDNVSWIDGMPHAGGIITKNNVATEKFWIDGMPMSDWVVPLDNPFFFLLGSPG